MAPPQLSFETLYADAISLVEHGMTYRFVVLVSVKNDVHRWPNLFFIDVLQLNLCASFWPHTRNVSLSLDKWLWEDKGNWRWRRVQIDCSVWRRNDEGSDRPEGRTWSADHERTTYTGDSRTWKARECFCQIFFEPRSRFLRRAEGLERVAKSGMDVLKSNL